jgi:AraC-like DNA-binding protein
MTFDFYDIIQSVIFFQLSVLIVVILQKGWQSISNHILAFFLFAQMMASMNGIWWNHSTYSIAHLPWLCHLSEPFSLLWGPLMFLYVVSRNTPLFRLRIIHFLHFIPSLAIAFYLILVFYSLPVEQKIEMLQSNRLYSSFLFIRFDIIVIVQVAIYNIAAILYQEKRLKNAILKNKLSLEKIKWNRFILLGYFSTCVIYDIVRLISPKYLSWEILKHLSFLLFAGYFTAILYKAIVSNIFSGEPNEKNRRNLLLPENKLEELARKAEIIMMSEKPYLNFNFGLKEMADRIGITDRLLSQAINECRKQNITDFINSYRIEEAKKMINNISDQKKTFLEIAYDSGFNSKSSFYLVFKKYTGRTPSEFKNQYFRLVQQD